MASFYVDTSQPNNGDGSSFSPASSAGAVGASNDLVSALKGTPAYGSIAAGDVIHVRAFGTDPKLAGDISATGALACMANIDVQVDVTGQIWPGSTGYIVIERPDLTRFTYPLRSKGIALRFTSTATYDGIGVIAYPDGVVERDGYIWTAPRHVANAHFQLLTAGRGRVLGTVFDIARGSNYRSFLSVSRGRLFELSGCVLDYRRNSLSNGIYLFDRADSYGAMPVSMKGCQLLGVDKVARLFAQGGSANPTDYEAIWLDTSFDYDPEPTLARSAANGSRLLVTGSDGQFGFIEETCRCRATWRNNQNYPTLNALLPDGVTPWSVRVLPYQEVGPLSPAQFSRFKKDFRSLIDKEQIITLELVIKDTYANPLDNEWWIEVAYTDSAGNRHYESSIGAGAPLAASSAVWNPMSGSNVTYGPNNYGRFQLSLSTRHAIAAGSLVSVGVLSSRPSQVDTDYYFVCPDFVFGDV